MLDDLKLLHERDRQDALGAAARLPVQLAYEVALSNRPDFTRIDNVVVAAVGSAALPARMVWSWLPMPCPLTVVHDYDIPAHVNHRTLFVAMSHSGNMEETLTALTEAAACRAQIAVIAGGGELQQVAAARGYFAAHLPAQVPARFSVMSQLHALLLVLEAADLLPTDVWPELERVSKTVKTAVHHWRPELATKRNVAKQLALELVGRSVLISSGPRLAPAADAWKIGCNLNAKQLAWTSMYPEISHNELIGWTKQPVNKPYAVVELRSELERTKIQKRMQLTERLLSGRRPQPIIVEAKGSSVLEQLVWCVVFGEFVSIYLAMLNGLNPTPIDLIEAFKRAIEEE